MKTTKITRKNYVPPAGHNALASYPWPRIGREGQSIDLDDPMLLIINCEGWDKESAQKYNTLLNTEILPTRFGHTETLGALGLDTDVFETLNAMGISPLCYQTHELYPDLVRQALATATIKRIAVAACSLRCSNTSGLWEPEFTPSRFVNRRKAKLT
ncbi:hypothetical protein F2Q70_00016257 [Brassica cretica]|uniref:Uncharacterized protein n=1 Tax=Brassica cretica TaxID=69181 RepID=A0A8S9KY61_BRACR|nr:hypothetical protein F2Q70_00016257 [Brassica cretica]KAF2600700.1 hypothetical protein F2Q68_00009238 [Brassica cretica]